MQLSASRTHGGKNRQAHVASLDGEAYLLIVGIAESC